MSAHAESKGKTESKQQGNGAFLTDVLEIRRRARQHIEKGAVTPGYKGDLATVIRLLNEALATELVCVLRYKRHHYMAKGIHSQSVAAEFLEHAQEEQGHADRIAERIVQLDGDPNFNPDGLLTRSHSEYVEGDSLIDMLKEDLVAERIAVESYTEMVRYLGDSDPTSRRLMEDILANEEEHADDINTLLEVVEQESVQRAKPGNSCARKCTTFAKESMEQDRRSRPSPLDFPRRAAPRRAGVNLKPGKSASASTRAKARHDIAEGKTSAGRKPSATRSRGVSKALRREGHEAASPGSLAQQARRGARSRGPQSRNAAAQKAVHTKGRRGLQVAARKAARTRSSSKS